MGQCPGMSPEEPGVTLRSCGNFASMGVSDRATVWLGSVLSVVVGPLGSRLSRLALRRGRRRLRQRSEKSPEPINPHSPRRMAERLQAQISCSPSASPAPRSLPLGFLTPDDVVDLEHLGRARIDPNVLQDRHEALSERIELRLRVPDLADSELPARLEGDVELESFREPIAGLLQTPNRLVVLLGRGRGGSEADEHARRTVVHRRRCCRRGTGGHEWPPSYGCLLTEPTYNRTRLTGARLATEDSEPERHSERITVSLINGLTEARNIGTRQLDRCKWTVVWASVRECHPSGAGV